MSSGQGRGDRGNRAYRMFSRFSFTILVLSMSYLAAKDIDMRTCITVGTHRTGVKK